MINKKVNRVLSVLVIMLVLISSLPFKNVYAEGFNDYEEIFFLDGEIVSEDELIEKGYILDSKELEKLKENKTLTRSTYPNYNKTKIRKGYEAYVEKNMRASGGYFDYATLYYATPKSALKIARGYDGSMLGDVFEALLSPFLGPAGSIHAAASLFQANTSRKTANRIRDLAENGHSVLYTIHRTRAGQYSTVKIWDGIYISNISDTNWNVIRSKVRLPK